MCIINPIGQRGRTEPRFKRYAHAWVLERGARVGSKLEGLVRATVCPLDLLHGYLPVYSRIRTHACITGIIRLRTRVSGMIYIRAGMTVETVFNRCDHGWKYRYAKY